MKMGFCKEDLGHVLQTFELGFHTLLACEMVTIRSRIPTSTRKLDPAGAKGDRSRYRSEFCYRSKAEPTIGLLCQPLRKMEPRHR